MSPSGKALDFDSSIRQFKSGHPSQQKRSTLCSFSVGWDDHGFALMQVAARPIWGKPSAGSRDHPCAMMQKGNLPPSAVGARRFSSGHAGLLPFLGCSVNHPIQTPRPPKSPPPS